MWQPIETSPKDGTPILTYGYLPEDYGYSSREDKVAVSHWCQAGRSSGWSSQGSTMSRQFIPTHWMAIPEYPIK